MVHYTVYPVNPSQIVQTTKTEAVLKGLYGESNVIPISHNGDQQGQVTDYWRVTSMDSSDLTTAIKNLEGVGVVKKDDSPETHTVHREEDDDDGPTFVVMANTSVKWQETEEFLKSKVRNGIKFFPIPDWYGKNEVSGWFHVALDPDAKAAVEQYEGVLDVSTTTFIQDSKARDKSIELSRRDKGKTFVVIANASVPWQKTEEFLRSKIRAGTEIFPMKDWTDKSQVYGWFPAALDPDAKAAVEQYEGVKRVKPSTFMQDFRAIPASDRPNPSQNRYQVQNKRTKLSTRDGKWEKQEQADKALVMDSQFE